MDPETLYGVFDAEPGPEGPAALYGGDAPRPRYNIGPTTDNPVVRERIPKPASEEAADSTSKKAADAQAEGTPVRTIELLHWGLVPSWAKDPSIGNRMFNARAETAATTAAFRTALGKRRCLVPVSGFYEWQKLAGGKGKKVAKQPFYITPEDGSVMALAGLWEYWRHGDDDPIVSYTIITTDAVGPMADIHDRMPLILPASDWDSWLDPGVDAQGIEPLLTPPDLDLVRQLEFRPVGARVGNVRNDDADLLEKVDPAQGEGGQPELPLS
jgi:putative SOS response-associated peptidase YedK